MDLRDKKTSDLFKEVNILLKEIEYRNSNNNTFQSFFDNKVQEIYHNIEIDNFNAYEGYKKSKKLQEVLRLRRIIKNDVRLFQSFTKSQKWADSVELVDNICRSGYLSEKSMAEQVRFTRADVFGEVTYSDIDKVYNESMNKNLKQLQERFNDIR